MRITRAIQRAAMLPEACDAVREVAELVKSPAGPELMVSELVEACQRVGLDRVRQGQEEWREAFLLLVSMALSDHSLTSDELEDLRRLKLLFGIEESDLYEHRRDEVEVLLVAATMRILRDEVVDEAEQLLQVNLQEILGLGYDQFLELTRKPTRDFLTDAVESIDPSNEGLTPAQASEVVQRLRGLETYFPIQITTEIPTSTRRSSRHIPQHVKDLVWRRDMGRCVECGSNELLEFDHIIPHTEGGANTYRNVQLLCQDCNRAKSDQIG